MSASHRRRRRRPNSGRHLFAVQSPGPAPASAPSKTEPDHGELPSFAAHLLEELAAHVGGENALECLDGEPLPDEPFDWSAVWPRDRRFVAHVLSLSDRCCEELLDLEYRTIARRILARVASRDPRVVRHSKNVERCAAGLVWLAGRANLEFGPGGRWRAGDLWTWFGVNGCAERGRSLQTGLGIEWTFRSGIPWLRTSVVLGDPALLHSQFRKRLIAERDLLMAAHGSSPRRTERPNRLVRIAAEPVTPVAAAKGILTDSGRAAIVIRVTGPLGDDRFLALSIPEGYDLVGLLGAALNDPLPKWEVS